MNKDFVRKYLPEITGSAAGTIGGFLYWKYIGCASGACPIKSNWYLMVPWGLITGYLVGSLAGDYIIKRKRKAGESADDMPTS